jgi:hypothetical protein
LFLFRVSKSSLRILVDANKFITLDLETPELTTLIVIALGGLCATDHGIALNKPD